MKKLRSRDRSGGTPRPLTPVINQSIATFGAGMTYARADATTCATRIDANGKLQLVAANTTPYDYTWGDQAYLSEESRANKCTNYNMVPSGTTGLSTTGTATVSAVSDTTAIAAAKLDAVVTGNVIEASGGASGGTVLISGTTGATGVCAASMAVREVTGTGASFGITPTPTARAISGAAYTRHMAEDLTATATTDQIVITLPAGVTIRFILNQLELGRKCTSIIKVDGVSRTRAKTSWVRTDLVSTGYLLASAGGMAFEVTPQEDEGQAAIQYIAVAGSSGSFPTEAFYLQVNSPGGKMQATGKGNNVANTGAVPNTGFMRNRKIPVGMTWTNNSDILALIGPGSQKSTTMSQTAGTLTTLTIGSAANISGNFNGWVHRIVLWNRRPTAKQWCNSMLGTGAGYVERGPILSGQSNAENVGNGTTTTGFRNSGEKAFRTYIDTILGTSTRNWLINGATGGTSFTQWVPGGVALTKWQQVVDAYVGSGRTIDAIWWDQGEADIGYTTAQLKAAWLPIFDYLRAYVQSAQGGTAPDVFLMPLGKYHFPATYNDATNNGAIAMRQAQRELAAENSYIHIGMEKFHQPLVDAIVHLTDAAYAAHAVNAGRLIYKTLGYSVSGGVLGPSITGTSRTGTAIAVTVAHDGGTDFSTHSPTVDGWRFFQNGNSATPITVNSVTYNSPTSLTVTLASDPGAGTHTIMYGDDLLWGDTQANLLVDNQTYPLALRQYINTALS